MRRTKKLPYVFNNSQIDEIIKTAREFGQKGGEFRKERNVTMILLGCDAGLREAEVANLRLMDIDFEKNLLKVNWEGAKLSKERIIVMSQRLREQLQSYIRNFSDTFKNGYLFSGGGKCIHGSTIRYNFGNILRKVGLFECYGKANDGRPMTKFHFHTLRHTFATNLVDVGVDLNTVSELLGHEDLDSTQPYLHTSTAKKREAISRLDAGSNPCPGVPSTGAMQFIDPELICPYCKHKIHFEITIKT